jgi:S-disulfanyl-L-cysteine oxidoreductase SoxD
MSRSREGRVSMTADIIDDHYTLFLSKQIAIGNVPLSPSLRGEGTRPTTRWSALALAVVPAVASLYLASPAAADSTTRHGLGRAATSAEIAGWAIDARPDGRGLPPGRGTAKAGEAIYTAQCASCHGEFGEGNGRWPQLAGGAGTLKSANPEKTVGSYWPYASTLFDYIRRAMPFGNAQSLSNDELYAVTAYVLYLNDVITDPDFGLDATSFKTIRLPNEANFYDDDRETTERHFWKAEPCMKDCVKIPPRITGRALSLDVTPDTTARPKE